jgi:murein DD-endopeptidase MepM/ murein hydrolase activator NlpD
MSKKYLTLMVIPHNEDRVREVNVSRPFLWGLSGVFLVSICALIFYTIGYYIKLHRELQQVSLQTENSELKFQFDRVSRELKNLRTKVDDLSETDRMMRVLVSLSEPGGDVRQVGVGGISNEAPPWEANLSYTSGQLLTETYTDLDQLLREAQFLEASFDTIASRLTSSEKVRNHTPSILPLPTNVDWWETSPFGYRNHPFTGRRDFHNGVDFSARLGTDVLATADGEVQVVNKDKKLGWYVSIGHGFGFRTVYGHLASKPPLRKGQKVKRGDTVGKLGDTGLSTGPHLHYTVIRNKRAQNPKNFIFAQKGRRSIF